MSHYGQSRATYIYRLMIDVAADRRLDYDPRIKTRSYEKPPLFRRDDSYLQQDYRHQVWYFYQRMLSTHVIKFNLFP